MAKKKPVKKSEFTPKQIRFCQEYVIDLNGTQSAIRAGYSKKTAKEQATRLLTNVHVQSKISELQKNIGNRLEVTAERVIAELAKVGFSNIQDYLDQGNEVKDLTTIDRDKAACVESIKIQESETQFGTSRSVSFKLSDKISALEKLGRHLGIFEKDNKQSANSFKIYNGIDPDKV